MILDKLEQGLSAQRIYQDIVSEVGFEGSYWSVRRFVNRLGERTPLPFRRMECAPGEEAQVDFGSGAPLITADGKRKKTWVFRIVLSHSRKAYSEAVFQQTTENFLRCLENAFRCFGGVPQTLVIDNLRAAVSKADWYSVLYRSIFDLVRDFLHDQAFEGQDKVLARYLKPDLPIIDDMGMKQLPKRAGEYVFEIIMRRYETRSTMMTSNRPLEDWGKLIGDVPSATAILDRFLHHAEIIQITGNSYRLRNQAAQNQEPDQVSRKTKSANQKQAD